LILSLPRGEAKRLCTNSVISETAKSINSSNLITKPKKRKGSTTKETKPEKPDAELATQEKKGSVPWFDLI